MYSIQSGASELMNLSHMEHVSTGERIRDPHTLRDRLIDVIPRRALLGRDGGRVDDGTSHSTWLSR